MRLVTVLELALVLVISTPLLLAAPPAQAGDDHGYLGVMLVDLDSSMAKALQLDDETGVLIREVTDDSPAEQAGLEDGDIILEFAGKKTPGSKALTRAVRTTQPGETVEVIVLRGGKQKSFDVELGKSKGRTVVVEIDSDRRPHDRAHFGSGDVDIQVFSDGEHEAVWFGDGATPNSERGYLGVHLGDLTEQLGRYFGVPDGKGALVTEIIEESPAQKAGLAAGDVIVKVGDEEVGGPMAIHGILTDSKPGQTVKVAVLRKGESKTFDVLLSERPEGESKMKKIKRIEIFGDDDVDGGQIDSQRRFMFLGRDGARGGMHDRDGSSPDVEILELHQGDEGPLDELRQELDELRKELEELREEMKK